MNSTEEQVTPSANRQIARAAGTVMGAIVLSQVVGLVAKSLVGSTFGTSSASEAFFAANRFSEILFNLVAGGALASAFIPTFTGLLAHDRREEAWKLASAVINLVLAVLVTVSLVSAVFAPALVKYILAPGFDAQKQALTVQLLRVQLPSAAIFGISGLCMGILNAHQSFLLPALAPSMYSFGWIFGALVLAPRMGIFGLGWGVVIGSVFHLLIQLPRMLRLPARQYHLTFGLHIPEVREVARLMGPRLLGVAVVQLNFLLNTILASAQPEGSLSGLSLAFPLMIMPEAAIAQAIAIAALPTFSAQVALGKLSEMRDSLAATLRSVLLLAVPATFGLILLREPIVRLVYMRNEFDETSLQFVAWALLWYAAGLVAHSLVEITARAFYALHDTKTPVLIGIAAMSLNLVLSLAFSTLFRSWGWMPHGGLALANSLATALETVGLLVLMRRRLNGLGGRAIWMSAAQALAGSAAMCAALLAWLAWSGAMPASITALGGVVCGGAAYLLVLAALRTPELGLLWSLPRRLLSRLRK